MAISNLLYQCGYLFVGSFEQDTELPKGLKDWEKEKEE